MLSGRVARWRSPAVLLAGLAVVLGACSSTSAPTSDPAAPPTAAVPSDSVTRTVEIVTTEDAAFDAAAACAAAAPTTAEGVDALATTVGEIRTFAAGPPGTSGAPPPLWPDAFAGVSPTTPAAWCTIAEGGGSYLHLAVSPGQPALELGREDGLTTPPPPGPPRVE